MRLEECIIIVILIWTLGLIILRLFTINEGKVQKRYRIGKSMTIGSRQLQEDQYSVCYTAHGLMGVLADGMGKEYGGKVAARIAVETFKKIFTSYNAFDNPVYFFNRAFHQANKDILNQLDEGRGGASVAAVVLKENELYYAVVGNVKIAVFRGGNLVPVSAGHTVNVLAEQEYYEGNLTKEDALSLLENHRLYNYIGQDGFKDIEIFDTPIRLRQKDIVAVMSDGIFEELDWKEIEEVLAEKKKCQDKAYDIIERINTSTKKDKDNASILLIEQT